MNIDYKSRGTRGTYTNQGARDKNLSLGFSHTGKKYSIHAGYIYNMASLKENGGILRDGDITDTVFDMPEVIDVYLTDAQERVQDNVFYLTQSYGMPHQAPQRRGFFDCRAVVGFHRPFVPVQPFLAQVHRYEERDGERRGREALLRALVH